MADTPASEPAAAAAGTPPVADESAPAAAEAQAASSGAEGNTASTGAAAEGSDEPAAETAPAADAAKPAEGDAAKPADAEAAKPAEGDAGKAADTAAPEDAAAPSPQAASPPSTPGPAASAAATTPAAASTPAPSVAVPGGEDGAGSEEDGDLAEEIRKASSGRPMRSPSGRIMSSPASPTASPSVAEHGFKRKADVERVPSMRTQPPEEGGIRVWATRASEWPPHARRARELLRRADAAADAAEAAGAAGEPREKVAELEAAAEAARRQAPDPDDLDWTDDKYAAYSLEEQLQAVRGVSEREARPAVSAEGFLFRLKSKEKTRKIRYFVLTTRALVYFTKAPAASVSSTGYLLADWDFPNLPGRFAIRSHGARIWLSDVEGIKTDLEARTIVLSRTEEKGGDVELEAATKEDCREWGDALDESMAAAAEAADAEDEEEEAQEAAGEAAGEGAAAAAAGAAAGEAGEEGGADAGATEGGADAPPDAAAGGGRARRPTLLGRMFGRGPKDPKADADRKAKDDAAAAARSKKAEDAAAGRAKRTEVAAADKEAKAEERRVRQEAAARQREVDRKKAVILAKQHREEEARRLADMSLEAVLKLKAETEARYRPVFWSAPRLADDASEEERAMTPTLQTLVEDRFRSYLEDRDGNPLALMRGWLSKDAESAISMGVPKDRYFVLTPYFLAYFCSEADAAVTPQGYMSGRAMGEKPRRLMRLGARIGLEHMVGIRANEEDDETDDVLGDLDTGAALAAERGDTGAAEALAREAKARHRAARHGVSAAEEGDGGASASSSRAKTKVASGGYADMMATTSDAAAADSGAGGRRMKRGSSMAGSKLSDGRCITPPKPRSKPPAPSAPPPGLAAKMMMTTARARLGSQPRAGGSMPRVESATLTADLADRVLRLQCHKVAYRGEWVRLLVVWQAWWRRRQEQLTLDQWSSAAAFRSNQAAAGMTKDEARKRRASGATGAAARRGGRRFVSGKGRGLPGK